MIDKIIKLPKWCILNTLPAFYDCDSVTATEQTARIYGKMNELIESYNAYVGEFNQHIEEYEGEHNKALSEFICKINCLCDDFINTVDMKIDHQNRKIAEVYRQFSDDVLNTIQTMLSDLKQSGELDNAILTALDDINTKVETFITDMTAEQEQLKTDYETTKSNLETDYQETKQSLESDYIGVRSQLEQDYQNVKGDLGNSFETFERQATEKIDGIGVEILNHTIPFGGQQSVQISSDIAKCKLVYVLIDDEAHCIANVIKISDTSFNIFGTGITSESGVDSVYLGIVNITGTITDNVFTIVSNGSAIRDFEGNTRETPITSIKGII